MEPVVAPAPGRTDPLVPMEDEGPPPAARQAGSRGEAGCPCSDHHDLGLLRPGHAARTL
jgi:hypothetical protein